MWHIHRVWGRLPQTEQNDFGKVILFCTDFITWWVMAELYSPRQPHNSFRRKVIKYFFVLVTNGPVTHLSEIPRMTEALAGRLWRPPGHLSVLDWVCVTLLEEALDGKLKSPGDHRRAKVKITAITSKSAVCVGSGWFGLEPYFFPALPLTVVTEMSHDNGGSTIYLKRAPPPCSCSG